MDNNPSINKSKNVQNVFLQKEMDKILVESDLGIKITLNNLDLKSHIITMNIIKSHKINFNYLKYIIDICFLIYDKRIDMINIYKKDMRDKIKDVYSYFNL